MTVVEAVVDTRRTVLRDARGGMAVATGRLDRPPGWAASTAHHVGTGPGARWIFIPESVT
jgi:hypothetical protein